MLTVASLTMSAADPWTVVLTAWRSACGDMESHETDYSLPWSRLTYKVKATYMRSCVHVFIFNAREKPPPAKNGLHIAIFATVLHSFF